MFIYYLQVGAIIATLAVVFGFWCALRDTGEIDGDNLVGGAIFWIIMAVAWPVIVLFMAIWATNKALNWMEKLRD